MEGCIVLCLSGNPSDSQRATLFLSSKEERKVVTDRWTFYDPAGGGDPVVYRHLFLKTKIIYVRSPTTSGLSVA